MRPSPCCVSARLTSSPVLLSREFKNTMTSPPKPCVGRRRLAGYPTCLAATVQLQAAGLLEGERAAAAHSAPGDAFERVYGKVAGRVRARVEAADPVLAQWIQASRPAPASAAAATLRVHAKRPQA